MNTVGVVIVNYNGYADTLACLESLRHLRTPGTDLYICVVDNKSTDESVQQLGAERARLAFELIESPANLGFSGGNNLGIRACLDAGCRFLWLLNSDTEVDPDALQFLLEAFHDPQIALCGSLLMDDRDRMQVQSVFERLDPTFIRTAHVTDRRAVMDDDAYVSFASVLIRAEAVVQCGLMDDRYFMYWEDVEYCWRLRSHGWRLACAPGSVVYHKESASANRQGARKAAWYAESHLRFAYQFFPQRLGLVQTYTTAKLLWRLLQGRPAEARAIWSVLRRPDDWSAAGPSWLTDDRWTGPHGIGRFAKETLARLDGRSLHTANPPLSPFDPVRVAAELCLRRPALYFSPGFNPPLFSPVPFVFTIHDLIHLQVPEELSRSKAAYYRLVVRPAARRAARVLTVSEYSKGEIVRWAGIPPRQVEVVGNGVDPAFNPHGPVHDPGYPYMLYIGNRKPHKNVPRLLEAFARISAQQPELRLVLSGEPDDETRHLALKLGVYHRVVFAGQIPEEELPALYRGAAVLTLPSLYEGFGLPPLEAMACGTPVVVSSTTSLPEVVGEAGVLVDPTSVESIASGLLRALTDEGLRVRLRTAGLDRARQFSWDRVAEKVRRVLAEAERP